MKFVPIFLWGIDKISKRLALSVENEISLECSPCNVGELQGKLHFNWQIHMGETKDNIIILILLTS